MISLNIFTKCPNTRAPKKRMHDLLNKNGRNNLAKIMLCNILTETKDLSLNIKKNLWVFPNYYDDYMDGLSNDYGVSLKNQTGKSLTSRMIYCLFAESKISDKTILIGSDIPSLTKKTIILKRHFGASLRDLLGAAEHILIQNNNNLIFCERGVSIPHTHRDTSRFALDIQAIPALKEISNYPVISDPSHASFWAPWVPSLTLASIAAGCDGLILEIHKNPKKSAVDPLQPLNFKQFSKLIKQSRKVSKAINRSI